MIYVLIFVFGAIIGSFLNVLIIRANTGESLFWPGSRCMSCGKKLKWLELIPIASFFIQRGRCVKCKSRISWQYSIVEALTGVIFVLIFWKIWNLPVPSVVEGGFWILIFCLLIVISVYDFRHQIIPNGFVYAFIVLSLLFAIFENLNFGFVPHSDGIPLEAVISDFGFRISDFAYRFFAGLIFFTFFGLLWLVSRGRWMGFGDAKLALGAGWLLGLGNGILAVLLSFWTGAVFAVFLLLFRGKDFTLKSRIPFGPFLALGIVAAFFLGGGIWEFYLKFFNLI